MKYSQQAILLILLLFSSQMMGQDINISEEMTTVEDSTQTGYRCYQPGCVVPSFPGGTEGLMTWLSENITYPAEAERDSIQGKVVVSFIIKPDGTPCNPEIISSPHSLLSQEALRVIGIMPKWNPGSGADLENTKYKLQLPLAFSLDSQEPIDSCQIDKQSSPSLAQKNIHTFKDVEGNIIVNKDGSYNAYLFIDTLHFENEGVILSRHDGHYYLFSDSSEIRNVKNYNNIIRENNVYIYQPDFIDYLTTSFNSEYLFNLIQRMQDPGGKIYPIIDYKTNNYFKMKFKEKPAGYYLCIVKGHVYNYLTYVSSADVYETPLKFPDDNAFYKLAIPYW